MKRIILSNLASQTLDEYFESYIGYSSNNDIWKRSLNYSRILSCLSQIEVFIDNTYVIDGRNFIIIKDIATIEYLEADFGILVHTIVFADK